MGSLTRWIALVGVAAGVLGTIAPPALGGQKRGPIAVAAFGGRGGTESANLSMPPNSNAEISTSDLPKTATKATVELDPLGSEADFKGLVDSVVEAFPSVGKLSKQAQGLVTCAFYSVVVARVYKQFTGSSLVKASNIYAAALAACLAMVVTLPSARDARVTPCARLERAAPVKIARTRSGYQLQAVGAISRPSGRSPVIISCQRKGKGLVIGIRPRRKGRTLRDVLGPKLTLGFVNPTKRSTGVHASLTVN